MNYTEVMAELKSAGTAQNIKIYKRHGAGDKLYGVSFEDLRALAKKIKKDQPLAEQLWASGNADARSLALLVADPDVISRKTADTWVRDIQYYLLADFMGGLAAKAPFAHAAMKKWTGMKKEYVRYIGYVTMASMLANGHPDLSDEECATYLKTIEAEIHGSANRARHAMNAALCAIGIYRPKLTRSAMAAAKRIGTVEVDHGETSCKTPDAVTYIQKAIDRKKKK